MPHIQVRSATAASPADLESPLDILRNLHPPVNIRAIATSAPDEDGGEIGLMLEDADIDRAIAALSDFHARPAAEADGMHLDYAADVPGGLLDAIRRARAHHPDLKIKDVAVSVNADAFTVDGNGNLLRDSNTGEVIEDPLQPHVHGHLVQIFFEGTRQS